MGHSDSGKTSLMNCLGGRTDRRSRVLGQVLLNGRQDMCPLDSVIPTFYREFPGTQLPPVLAAVLPCLAGCLAPVGGLDCVHLEHMGRLRQAKFRAEHAPRPRIS